MKEIPDWIIIEGSPGEAVCRRCGEREAPRLPMSIDAFVKWLEYFGKKHSLCKEKK